MKLNTPIKNIIINNRYSVRIRNLYITLVQKLNIQRKLENFSIANLPDFLSTPPHVDGKKISPAEKIIYTFWTGENELSENRKRCLNSIKEISQVKVVLITPKNIENYILPLFPLHKSYEYLSLVHKADYLRCYFMHHYGGGYCDIKELKHSWLPIFDEFNSSNKYICGFQENGYFSVAHMKGNNKLRNLLEYNYLKLVGTSAFICKPNTPFTKDWIDELHKKLDYYYLQLKSNPGNARGTNKGYPIPWTNILGDITHPLCLKYEPYIMMSKKIEPNFFNYK